MASGIVVDGLRETLRDLRLIDKSLAAEARRAMRTAGEPVRAEAARRAPRRSGALAESLRISTAGARVQVMSRLPYAKTIHWGGRHPVFGNTENWVAQAARPFIADAAEAKGEQALGVLADELDGLMSRHGFK